jgi:hypothetical protein
MITRNDERLLSTLRRAGMEQGVPLHAHTDVKTHVDRPGPKVHYDHGPRGTPEHTDGMVENPASHTDRDSHLEQAIASDDSGAPIWLPPAAGQGPGLSAAQLEAVLARLEDVLVAREQQLHRDVSLRLDAFVAEVADQIAKLQAQHVALEGRLDMLERETGARTE